MTHNFEEKIKTAGKIVEEKNADFLQKLKGLTEEEIKTIVPQGTSAEEYKALIKEVQEATEKNLAQAQLITNIQSLGDVAIRIAKKIKLL